MAGIIQQFKSHVRCLLEQSAVAIYHAAQTHLKSLNALQRNFVNELGTLTSTASSDNGWMLLRLQRATGRGDTGVSLQKFMALVIILASLCSA